MRIANLLAKHKAICSVIPFLLSAHAVAIDLDEWTSSEARAELITEFESNDCRLTLTEVSDFLFDFDMSEEHIYTERLILMEPEQSALTFPVVLIKSDECKSVDIKPIEVPLAALNIANDVLTVNSCTMEIAALEGLSYPTDTIGELTPTDRRNIVSELYNRGDITFQYFVEDGVEKLRVHKLTGECPETKR